MNELDPKDEMFEIESVDETRDKDASDESLCGMISLNGKLVRVGRRLRVKISVLDDSWILKTRWY